MEEAPSSIIGKALGYSARLVTVLGVVFFGFQASSALAATMYLSPSSGTYASGSTFSVGVYVSSTDEAMNAVSGTISFPPSIIEATSVSQSGSIINLWSQQPSYSNSSGTVTFEGIVLNPGYTGSGGKIATITFSAKTAGTAAVAFSRGSILANDGLGSDITSGLGSATFAISESGATTPVTPAAPATATPSAPSVSSSTHPDQNAWYGNANPSFSWSLPSGVTGVNVLADHGATTNPGTTSDGLRSSYSYTDVDDGQWYFHVRLQNSVGWGGVTHFAFNIDTVAPTVTALVQDGTPQKILVTGLDELSGIDHYGFAIDGGAETSWTDDGSHAYTLPSLAIGEHTVIVTAYDKAGNTATTSVHVLGQGTELGVPVLNDITVGLEQFTISGAADPNGSVMLFVQINGGIVEEHLVQSSSTGVFSLKLAVPERGTVRVWAQAIGVDGEYSAASNDVSYRFGMGPAFVWLLYGILFLILLLALIAVLVMFWRFVHHASKYTVVVVKREVKHKDPYRHLRRRVLKIFAKVQKKADRRREKGLVTKTGRRAVDQDLEAFIKDVVEQAQSIRTK